MSPLGTYVVETLLTLVVIVGLAVVVLYVARRAGIGRATGPVELVGRLPLDGRRAVYLVRVEAMIYVVGASEAGLVKLGQFARDDIVPGDGAEAPVFSEVLRRAFGPSRHPSAVTPPSESPAAEPAAKDPDEKA